MREIELRPVKGRRGDREIIVDGEQWGWVIARSRGSYGYSYKFGQLCASAADWYEIEREPINGSRKSVEFFPTRPGRVDRTVRGIKAEPLDDQLRRQVDGMIKIEQLRDPEIVVAERAEANRKYVEERDAAALKEAQAFDDRAKACLDPLDPLIGTIMHIPCGMRQILTSNIVRAMRWAQER